MDILFVGVGTTTGGVSHYRTIIPARTLNQHWIIQSPVDGKVIAHECTLPSYATPDITIFQMPVFDWHATQIIRAKQAGTIVCSNIDDYIPSLYKHWKRGSHGHGHVFDKKLTDTHLRCIGLSDYILCSTPWIADKYSSLGEVKLFKNGIDAERYEVGEINRDMGFVVGWSGGTGHNGAFREIAGEVRDFLWDNPEAKFVSMGDDMTAMVNTDGSLKDRVFSIGWNDLHLYPRDMVIFDVSLAPAEHNDFFRAKSQLRLYEAGMLGIPVIGSYLYNEIDHGKTGFIVHKPGDYKHYLQLLHDEPDRRIQMGKRLKKWVEKNATAEARREEWDATLRDLQYKGTAPRPKVLQDLLQANMAGEET